jgi:hypothetical protein
MVFSPKNKEAGREATNRVLREMLPRLTLEKDLSGKQL